jgi:hypothetical protein
MAIGTLGGGHTSSGYFSLFYLYLYACYCVISPLLQIFSREWPPEPGVRGVTWHS